MNRTTLLLILMAIAPTVKAGPMGDERLLQSIRALEGAGFGGIKDIKVPAPVLVAQAEENPVNAMLRSYADQILAAGAVASPGIGGEAARKLGFKPIPGKFDWHPDGTMPIKGVNIKKSKTGEKWVFAATDVRGKKEIVLAYWRDEVQTLYLVTLDGTLEKAVVNSDGTEIPLAEAKAGFQATLDFWLRYYKKNPQLQFRSKD